MNAHRIFKTIVYQWLRVLGQLVGQDIFLPTFKIHWYTLFVFAIASSIVFSSIWTFFHFDDKRSLNGGSFVFVSLKVRINPLQSCYITYTTHFSPGGAQVHICHNCSWRNQWDHGIAASCVPSSPIFQRQPWHSKRIQRFLRSDHEKITDLLRNDDRYQPWLNDSPEHVDEILFAAIIYARHFIWFIGWFRNDTDLATSGQPLCVDYIRFLRWLVGGFCASRAIVQPIAVRTGAHLWWKSLFDATREFATHQTHHWAAQWNESVSYDILTKKFIHSDYSILLIDSYIDRLRKLYYYKIIPLVSFSVVSASLQFHLFFLVCPNAIKLTNRNFKELSDSFLSSSTVRMLLASNWWWMNWLNSAIYAPWAHSSIYV